MRKIEGFDIGETVPVRCSTCGSWDMTPERGRLVGICLAGRGETHAEDVHLRCWQPIVRNAAKGMAV